MRFLSIGRILQETVRSKCSRGAAAAARFRMLSRKKRPRFACK